MSDFKEFVDDMFYFNLGAAATIKDKVSDKVDEYIDRGKEFDSKSSDDNKELKYNKEKGVVSILDNLTSEEKLALKEALVNEE
ncbi:MAG: hypothetical protein IJ619_00835 [Eubacterium sp.]|nr:hypothetical protein [Eubacterium sp.]